MAEPDLDTSVPPFEVPSRGTWTELDKDERAQSQRYDCMALAIKTMVDSKLFESGTVSADDLGPYVCEVAHDFYEYLTKGILPEYPERDEHGNIIDKE